MKNVIKDIFEENISLTEKTLAENAEKIDCFADAILKSLKAGGKVIIFGNGGSAADSQHFAAELVGRFQKERAPIAAIALGMNVSLSTAIGNDYGFDVIFSRELEAIAKKNDVAIGISTSGNSKNVLEAIKKAKSLGLTTIGLLGCDGGKIKNNCDISLVIPSKNTPRIQENHILILHIVSKLIEDKLF